MEINNDELIKEFKKSIDEMIKEFRKTIEIIKNESHSVLSEKTIDYQDNIKSIDNLMKNKFDSFEKNDIVLQVQLKFDKVVLNEMMNLMTLMIKMFDSNLDLICSTTESNLKTTMDLYLKNPPINPEKLINKFNKVLDRVEELEKKIK